MDRRAHQIAAVAWILLATVAPAHAGGRPRPGWVNVSDRHQLRLPASGKAHPLPRSVVKRLGGARPRAARGQIAERHQSFADGDFLYAEATLGRRDLGYARYKGFRGPGGRRTMLFDVVVAKQARRNGVYRALFAHALARLGPIERAPILLSSGSNFDVFVRGAFGGKPGLRRATLDRITRMDASARQDLRARLVTAAAEMPAARVREHHGFGRIVSIRFNPAKGTALVDFARGPAAPLADVRVFVSTARDPGQIVLRDISEGRAPAGPIHEIDQRGALHEVRPSSSAWRVGGYDQSKSYRFHHYREIP